MVQRITVGVFGNTLFNVFFDSPEIQVGDSISVLISKNSETSATVVIADSTLRQSGWFQVDSPSGEPIFGDFANWNVERYFANASTPRFGNVLFHDALAFAHKRGSQKPFEGKVLFAGEPSSVSDMSTWDETGIECATGIVGRKAICITKL